MPIVPNTGASARVSAQTSNDIAIARQLAVGRHESLEEMVMGVASLSWVSRFEPQLDRGPAADRSGMPLGPDDRCPGMRPGSCTREPDTEATAGAAAPWAARLDPAPICSSWAPTAHCFAIYRAASS